MKKMLYLVWIILSVTGIYFAFRQDWQQLDPIPLTIYTLKIHGLSAYFFLVILGSLIPLHIRPLFKARQNLITGLPFLIGMIVLTSSGTLLYYSPESMTEKIKLAHIFIGITLILFLPLHIFIGKKKRLILAFKRKKISQ